MGKQSGARCMTHRENKGFPVVPHQRPFRTAPATVTHHAYLQHYRHLRARPHRRERCRLHRRQRRHPGRCGPGWRRQRLSGTSPRARSSSFCVARFARVTTRARARGRAGDRLTSRACACVRARVRDESSAIHAVLCARAARPRPSLPAAFPSQTDYLSGASSLDISYTGFPLGEAVDIKLCFTDEKIKKRPWRKYVNNLEKNKQCWQTADLLKILKKNAVTTGSGRHRLRLGRTPCEHRPLRIHRHGILQGC